MLAKIAFALIPVVLWGALEAQLTALSGASAQSHHNEEQVRDLIARWNTAYRALDSRALAALETDDYQMVDRFGEWYDSRGAAENERLWAWAFANIYRGKPGPDRHIESIRFLQPDVSIVMAKAQWGEIKLDDGRRIPPHGEIDTFVVVRDGGAWKVSQLDIANQMESSRPGEHSDIPHE